MIIYDNEISSMEEKDRSEESVRIATEGQSQGIKESSRIEDDTDLQSRRRCLLVRNHASSNKQ